MALTLRIPAVKLSPALCCLAYLLASSPLQATSVCSITAYLSQPDLTLTAKGTKTVVFTLVSREGDARS